VADGDTDSEPEVVRPPDQPPDAVHPVAFDAVHCSTTLAPLAIDGGVAVSDRVGGGVTVGGRTVTLTDCIAFPPLPEQVSANEAFDRSGPVEADPDVARDPLQFPEAAQAVAFVEDQTRVALPPELMAAGDTERTTVGGGGADGGWLTVAVTVWAAEPPAPVQVKVYDVVASSAPVDSVPVRVLSPLQPPDARQAEASLEVQLRSAALLWATALGATPRETVGAGGGNGVVGGADGGGVTGADGVGAGAGASCPAPPEHAEMTTAVAIRAAGSRTNAI
jgi:hypothetical protein